jgi:preprotein translocase subunit SecY
MKNSKKNTLTLLKQIFTNKTVIVTLILTILLLVFFHIGSIFPAPGIQISGQFYNDGSSIAGMLNLLAGGGLSRMSIFAVGIGPYITAQIIVQLLSSDLIPPLSKLAKMGERGRRKLEILTRIITLPFCIAQSYAVLALLLNNNTSSIISIFGVNNYTGIGEIPAGQTFALILMFIAGTYIAIFLGDLITKRGVGNGVTLLILAGIVSSLIANFSTALQRIDQLMPPNSMHLTSTILSSMLYILFFIVILFCIVFINGATRKIPIQQTGQGLTNEIKTLPFLPIKLNPAGVIPVIFASSIMTIPGTIAQFLKQDSTRWFIEKYLIIES